MDASQALQQILYLISKVQFSEQMANAMEQRALKAEEELAKLKESSDES